MHEDRLLKNRRVPRCGGGCGSSRLDDLEKAAGSIYLLRSILLLLRVPLPEDPHVVFNDRDQGVRWLLVLKPNSPYIAVSSNLLLLGCLAISWYHCSLCTLISVLESVTFTNLATC